MNVSVVTLGVLLQWPWENLTFWRGDGGSDILAVKMGRKRDENDPKHPNFGGPDGDKKIILGKISHT